MDDEKSDLPTEFLIVVVDSDMMKIFYSPLHINCVTARPDCVRYFPALVLTMVMVVVVVV